MFTKDREDQLAAQTIRPVDDLPDNLHPTRRQLVWFEVVLNLRAQR